MHRWVLAANSAAHRFYRHHGGEFIEQASKPIPDGSTPAVCRHLWCRPVRPATAERGGPQTPLGRAPERRCADGALAGPVTPSLLPSSRLVAHPTIAATGANLQLGHGQPLVAHSTLAARCVVRPAATPCLRRWQPLLVVAQPVAQWRVLTACPGLLTLARGRPLQPALSACHTPHNRE